MSEPAKRLNDLKELLHRQVHPEFVQDGSLSSQAFHPFPSDNGKLSVDRDAIASAQNSYELHVNNKKLASAGTWSVSVGECLELELPPISDPVEEPVSNLAHCLIQFDDHSRSQRKKRAKKLRDSAAKRGATFQPSKSRMK